MTFEIEFLMAKSPKYTSASILNGRGKKIAIVVSKFNEFITKRLLNSCLAELYKHGVKRTDVTTVFVPGSLEIPLVALKIAQKKNIDAVICLGAVIRGETYHFEVVANGCVQGIMQANLETEKPIIFGVLTVNSDDQALRRSEDRGDNKGREAAVSALEMVNLLSHV